MSLRATAPSRAKTVEFQISDLEHAPDYFGHDLQPYQFCRRCPVAQQPGPLCGAPCGCTSPPAGRPF